MIVPRPTELTPHPGRFVIGPQLHLDAGPGTEQAAELLAGYLGRGRTRSATGPRIELSLSPTHPTTTASTRTTGTNGANGTTGTNGTNGSNGSNGASGVIGSTAAQGYLLRIRPDLVTLSAPATAGLLNGVQTLRQLLPPAALDPAGARPDHWWWPCLDIRDQPRLAWRGALLDVARHFLPLEFLYRFVDELALHKLNVFQLHLNDDQGWRIEIDGLPRLTEVGAWRTESALGPGPTVPGNGTPHGGYYTQAELRGLVSYARGRGVSIVPEITMPGHARAVLAAYPHLGNHPDRALPVWTNWGISEDILAVSDQALDFCRQVLAQTMDVFPSRYLHIGGDECPTVQWQHDPLARERTRQLGLAAPAELHGWFLRQMQQYVTHHGRRAIAWDEKGYAANTPPPGLALTAWRDQAHGAQAIARGHQVVIAPHLSTYFDYPQSNDPTEPQGQPGHTVTLADVYAFDPLAGSLPTADPAAPHPTPGVLGTQAQLWTEYAPTPEHVTYLTYPRLCALAEVAWTSGPRDLTQFQTRLAHHNQRLNALGLTPRRPTPAPTAPTPGTMNR
ncbi:beta-N-acetylhexosaminidase [Streptacidiphilus sp. P02-A3a]|uniref:beta-N-acetylhexosaminidase n=1 Tax=Streptacidiphilus sp. P02-A3a TaxID=2704468 RepID=UPI0015FC4FB9|nr:beta-N-acetylhexosaminidase [Streptacidiphilus sp. P02-A3a]QMU70074.1 beta-N-acetylhexosaminidase [Streptacidiphilus sp. P02-A3a]